MPWRSDMFLAPARRSKPKWHELTAPASEPISVQDVRHALRIEQTADDSILARYILAARNKIEWHTSHLFITRQIQSLRDHWLAPAYDPQNQTVYLLPGPVSSIDEVAYVTGGTLTVLAPTDYQVDINDIPARLYPAPGQCWPDPDDVVNAVQVKFTAGYPDVASTPDALNQALYLLVGHWYENRVPFQQDGRTPVEIPMGYDWLVRTFTRGTDQ